MGLSRPGIPSISFGMAEAENSVRHAIDSDVGVFTFKRDRWSGMVSGTLRIILGVLLLIALWYLIAELVNAWKHLALFPTPVETFGRLLDFLAGGTLYNESIFVHAGASLGRWGLGYLLAVAVGIGLGVVLGVTERVHDIAIVPIYIFQMIPGLAWVPISLLIFGLGSLSTIFMIFMTALPPIAISTSSGIRGVDSSFLKASRMMGAGDTRIFLRILLPASSLSIINGLRIGLANGWRVLIAAEMVVGVAIGLGYSIFQSRWSLDFEAAFVCIVIICLIGLLVEKFLFVVLEEKVRERMGLTEAE